MTRLQLRLILVACLAAIAASSTVSAQRWGHGPLPRDGACFYKDPDFHGDYFCLAGGEELGAMSGGANDKISSIRIIGPSEVTVFTDVRFAGNSTRFAGNVRDLQDEKWNDRISSLRVRSTVGASVRPASDADEIVRRAYLELLDREPDPQGFTLYRNHMVNDGWSEDRVRQTLWNSPEFRAKGGMTVAKAQEIVRRAYAEVLKRDPDPASQSYVDRVMRDRWSQQDVERELRKSDEFRRKQ
jgi:Peptidase inhibitor family I36/Domain of unknown function (DUF4214)